MNRKTWLLLVLLLGAAFFSGCKKTEQTLEQRKADNAVVLGVLGSPGNLNFLLASDDGPWQVEGILFRGLTRWNEHWREEALWAERVPSPETRLARDQHIALTYQIRPDARWADGKPLTADDFLFTYEMALLLPRPLAPDWSHTFTFHTEGRDRLQIAFNPSKLDDEVRLLPLPAHLIRPQIRRNAALFLSFDYNREPVGCGPFVGQTWGKDRVDLVPNPNYPLARPALSRLQARFYPDAGARLAALQAGQIDAASHLSNEEVAGLNGNQDYEVSAIPTRTVWCLEFSLTDPFFKDPRVREALVRALDRGAVAREAEGPLAQGAESWLPPQHSAYLAVFADLKSDVEAARKTLQDVGVTAGTDKILKRSGRPVEVNLVFVAGEEARRGAEAVARMWEALGLQVHLSQVSRAELATLYSTGQKPGVLIAAHAMGPWVQPAPIFGKGAIPSDKNSYLGENHSGWNNTENERLCAEVQENFNREVRDHAMQDQQKLVREQIPMAPLFYGLEFSAHRKAMEGWKPRGLGQNTWNAEEWHWK